MSFGHPLLLLSLLVVPLAAGLYMLAERRRARYAVRFTNIEVLAAVAGGRSRRRLVPPLLFLLAIAVLCVGFARPHVNKLVPTDKATVILVIDDSGSMMARDVKPTRLGAAQAAVRTFLDRVPKRVRVGLIVFAAEPMVAAPPTTDHDLVRESVDAIGEFPGARGTAIGDALAAAVELGKQAIGGNGKPTGITIAERTGGPRSPVSILFLSDGAQTRGELQPLEGAERAKAAGFPVYTIALGTPNGTLQRGFGGFGGGFFGGQTIPVPPDPGTLREVATQTGGRFFAARTAEALQSAYKDLGSRLGRVPGTAEVTNQFLAVAALLLLSAWLLSMLWAPRLP